MSDTVPAPPPAPAPHGGAAMSRGLWAAIVIGVALVSLGVWLVFAKLPGILSREPGPPGAAPAAKASDAKKIQATLYYVSDDGTELVPVNREVVYGATPAEQARHILDLQVQSAPDGYASAIAAGTSVRAVFLAEGGEAFVDLSPEAAAAHSGGALNEALAVFAIVNALTTNLPTVTSVQILVDGREIDSLAGHIDLREPLTRTPNWVRKGQ